MKRLLNLVVALSIAFMAFLSCEETESYSEIPEIAFTKYRVYDTSYSSGFNQRNVAIYFTFVDGDGDIGDTTQGRNNLIFSRFEQRNGEFINVDTLLADTIQFRIPFDQVMLREGQNKTIKGSVKVDLSELIINYDTIKYEFYIKDRAGNKSNVTSTTPITGLKN